MTAIQLLEARLRAQYQVVENTVAMARREFRLLRPRSADDLIDEIAFNRDGRIPYWAEVWISGRLLGELLIAEAQPGLRLLELGCGIGTTTYAALAAGYQVTASDYYGEALEFVQLNVWRNRLPEPALRVVDWRDLPADLGRFERVVAADVLYEPPYAALLADTIAHTLAPGGQALVTDPQRPGSATFAAECQQRELVVARQELTGQNDSGRLQTVQLFRITWP